MLGEDEWYAEDLEGCRVVDGDRSLGRVRAPARAAVVRGARGRARRRRRPARAARRATPCARSTWRRGGSTSTARSGWVSDGARRLHPLPRLVRLVPVPAPRRATSLERGVVGAVLQLPRPHAAVGGDRSTTRRSAAAPGWCCGSTWSTRRCAPRYGDPVERARPAHRRPDARRAAARRRAGDELAREPALTLLCGRYEGFDERIVEHLATDAISIGRYVLVGRRGGGDGASATRCCASCPGALGDERLGASRSPSARRSRGARSTRTTRARELPRLARCPRCSSRATTRGSAQWRREQAGARRRAAAAYGPLRAAWSLP